MSRRRHDPQLPAVNLVTDPVREAEIQTECGRQMLYLKASCQRAKKLELDRVGYNRALKAFKAAVKRFPLIDSPMKRLHVELETQINIRARKLAALERDAMLLSKHAAFVTQAMIDVAHTAKARRGRPGSMLRPYVAGLMAIMQEATGHPVLAQRDQCSVYEPRLLGTLGKTLRLLIDSFEPRVTDTALVQMVHDIRAEYAGRPMWFQDLFPLYGARPASNPVGLSARSPYRIQMFAVNAPIYSPSHG